jgi:hypothetical protein
MRSAKVWLCAAFVMAALAGASLLTATVSSVGAAAAARAPAKATWHYHDGRWSYWDEGDHRWYYTDGSHWFFEDNNAWKVYRFDKTFGREGCVGYGSIRERTCASAYNTGAHSVFPPHVNSPSRASVYPGCGPRNTL